MNLAAAFEQIRAWCAGHTVGLTLAAVFAAAAVNLILLRFPKGLRP